ncbi:MAG: Calx-beta domain-containing protein [Cyanobacteria bacterium P01_F01_bin.150]
MKKDPGNSLKKAHKVKLKSNEFRKYSLKEKLNSKDNGDLYFLNLENPASLDLSLFGTKAKVNVVIYNLKGKKRKQRKALKELGKLDFNDLSRKQIKQYFRTLKKLAVKPGKHKDIDDFEFNKGKYYIRIFQKRPKKTPYTLELEPQSPTETLPGILSFTTSAFQVSEDSTTTAPITVTRTDGSSGEISATINLVNGSAEAPQDYNSTPITVIFANGETGNKIINVPIVDDTLVEGDETVTLNLSSADGSAIGNQAIATLTINDNDSTISPSPSPSPSPTEQSPSPSSPSPSPVTPSPSTNQAGTLEFGSTEFKVNEDGTAVAAVVVTRTRGTSGEVTVIINLTDGSATAPKDYNASAISVTFADEETSKIVHIPIVDDESSEETETINLSLTDPTNGASLGRQLTAILTIEDNDIFPGYGGSPGNLSWMDPKTDWGVMDPQWNPYSFMPAWSGLEVIVSDADYEPPVDEAFYSPTVTILEALSFYEEEDYDYDLFELSSYLQVIFDTKLEPERAYKHLPFYINQQASYYFSIENPDRRYNNDFLSLSISNPASPVGFSKETYVLQREWFDEANEEFILHPSELSDLAPEDIFYLANEENHPNDVPKLVWGGKFLRTTVIIVDSLNDFQGNDDFQGKEYSDKLFGGPGDDVLRAGGTGEEDFEPTDYLHGGSGNDTLYASLDSAVLYGGSGNDILFAGSDSEIDLFFTLGYYYLYGDSGNDKLYGNIRSDYLDGGFGDDFMAGGLGDDHYVVDSLDDIVIEEEDSGNDRITILVDGYVIPENIEEVEYRLVGDSGSNTFRGGDRDDDFFGQEEKDTLVGGDGDDLLEGGDGDDFLEGGNGDDFIKGGDGDDLLRGGDGEGGGRWFYESYRLELDGLVRSRSVNDLLYGGDGNDTLIGDDGNDFLEGGNGDDLLKGGEGSDDVYGGDGDDTLTGGEGYDALHGNDGNDMLSGGDTDDDLYGNDGDDFLKGGEGSDDLEGGNGDDTLTGGRGSDSFRFREPSEGIDIITDFSAADGDKVKISRSNNGFGIDSYSLTPEDLARFTFNRGTGELFFNTTKIIEFQSESGFSEDFFIPSLHIDLFYF